MSDFLFSPRISFLQDLSSVQVLIARLKMDHVQRDQCRLLINLLEFPTDRLVRLSMGEEEEEREVSSPGKEVTSCDRVGTFTFALPRLNVGPSRLRASRPEPGGRRPCLAGTL